MLWFAVLSGVFVIVGLVMVLLEVRMSRAVRKQLSELARRAKDLQDSINAMSQQRLVELLPEECDAAMERVSNAIVYYGLVEGGVADERRESLKRRSFDPFARDLSPGDNLLPSSILGRSLAALRAVKARYHADPKTFSREAAWVYGGRHDELRKRLTEAKSASDAALPVGQGQGPERRTEPECKGGVS